MRRFNRLAGMAGVGLAMYGMGAAPLAAETQQGDREVTISASELERLHARIDALEAEVRDPDSSRQQWLDQRRADDVRRLIEDVMADAETRTTAQSGNVTAGYDGDFFLASADNAFRLEVGGQVQLRYIANFRDNAANDDTTTGFQHRRTKLSFSGHIADPRLGFEIVPVVSRNGGNISIEDVQISYDFSDELSLVAGTQKVPFMRETLNSSKRQLAVERSLVEDEFDLGRSTGVQLEYDADPVRLAMMVSDGSNQDFAGFQNTMIDYGISGRADVRLAGEWSQMRDFSAWNDEPFGAFIGAAAHFDGGIDGDVNDRLFWTVDGSMEASNIGVYGAVVGRHDVNVDDGVEKFSDLGALVQASYMIDDRIEPFVRFERLMPDSSRDADDIDLVTVGGNYYFRGHNVKLTSDVVWVMDPLDGSFRGGSNGLGLLTDAPDEDGQVVWRTQFQLLF